MGQLREPAATLDTVLADPRIWRGRTIGNAPAAVPSGHAPLDNVLPGGGWPRNALSEILIPADGHGELQLLLPTLAAVASERTMVALIDPPYVPFPPAWHRHGVNPAWLAIVDSGKRDSLWAAEQCLRSGACAAVLLWPRQVTQAQLRRLQVAAESGQSMGFVYRDAHCASEASPAAVRVQLHPGAQGLEVLKCRGSNCPPGRLASPGRAH